jgi:hypoxanthine phosphoribosyltransferase
MTGALVFSADLLRHIGDESVLASLYLFTVQASSYGDGQTPRDVKIDVDQLIRNRGAITDRDVVVIEDILDSGQTLLRLVNEVISLKPRSVGIALLMVTKQDQPTQYRRELESVTYNGRKVLNKQRIAFEVPQSIFYHGYGIDDNGEGRGKRNICGRGRHGGPMPPNPRIEPLL